MYKFNSELYTYNPIKGECIHDCSYCFMKSIRHRFKQDPTLRLDAKELRANLGQGHYIFVDSSSDACAADVPTAWIIKVLDHLNRYPDNEYMLQSKNPARFLEFVDHKFFKDCKDKLVLCTTIESHSDYPNVSKAPLIAERVAAMNELSDLGFQTMVTIEPIMDFYNPATFASMIETIHSIQVNIGANTSKTVKLKEPSRDKILALIAELEARGITVHQKDNLARLLK